MDSKARKEHAIKQRKDEAERKAARRNSNEERLRRAGAQQIAKGEARRSSPGQKTHQEKCRGQKRRKLY